MVLEHQLLRCKPLRFSANETFAPFSAQRTLHKPMPPTEKESNIVTGGQPSTSSPQATSSRTEICFVRVEDSLFKVPQSFFSQMPPEPQDSTKFASELGKTPEKPILLSGHSSHQFRQVVNAYISYPQININSISLDHFLTIGELAYRYHLRDLAFWFVPIFKELVTSHQTPLRKAANAIYVRTMKLAITYGTAELVNSISTKWISRMHWRELDPLSAMLFADTHGMRDLLSHACYIYLMLVYKRIKKAENIDARGLLTPRQKTYIMSGYHSLTAYWNNLRQNPTDFDMAPLCGSHSQCVGAWRLRWLVAMEQEYPMPDVDVLGRLIFAERYLRDDMLLDVVVTPGCKALALKSISIKRELVSRQLHHHFDL